MLKVLIISSRVHSSPEHWMCSLCSVFNRNVVRCLSEPRVWPPLYIWSTEEEAAFSENGLKSVCELSQPESRSCDDEVLPGTNACSPHVMKLKPHITATRAESRSACFTLCAVYLLISAFYLITFLCFRDVMGGMLVLSLLIFLYHSVFLIFSVSAEC